MHSHAVLAKQQAAPFSPSDVAGLVAWWDASTLGLADNDPISTFTDGSGAGNHATAAGGDRATFKTGIKNGLAVARFASDYMTTAAVPTAVVDNYTQLTLCALTSGSGVPVFIGNGGANGWGVTPNTSSANKFGSLRGGIAWQDSAVNADTSWHLLVGRRAAGSFNLYKDGGASILTVGSAPNAPTTSASLGGHTTGARIATVDLGEALVYAAALSDADVNLVGAYLCTKWGLTWTNI